MQYATCSLAPLDIKEARSLLASRMGADRDIAPLTDENLRQLIGPRGFCNPRSLLDQAARMFDQINDRIDFQEQKATLPEWLAGEWERRLEKSAQQNEPSSTGEILRHGLPLLVRVLDPQWKTAAGKQNVALDYVLTGPQKGFVACLCG